MNNSTALEALRSIAISDNAAYRQYDGHFDSYVLVRVASHKGLRARHKAMMPIGSLQIARAAEHASEDVHGKTNTFRVVYAQHYGDVSVPARDVVLA